MDNGRMLSQSDGLLEHALNMHVQKTTKILVLRHMAFANNDFGTVARVVKDKHADLMQIILKDCEVPVEFAAAADLWLNPDEINDRMMHGLLFATKKLVLVNYTVRCALSVPLFGIEARMPSGVPGMRRQNRFKELPVVLPRHEFDCSKPFHEHYHAFIMALNRNCPEVCPEIRKEVIMLYRSWIHTATEEYQWQSLGVVVEWLNDGVPTLGMSEDSDVLALRHLDPLTLNKLTVEALHRMYF